MPSNSEQRSDLEDLREIFAQEAEQNLAVLEEGLIALESDPEDRAVLGNVFRAAHTIKGGAFLVDLRTVGSFSHAMEDALDRLRAGSLELDETLATRLLKGVDALRTMMADIRRGEDPDADSFEDLRSSLERYGDEDFPPEDASPVGEPAGPAPEQAEGSTESASRRIVSAFHERELTRTTRVEVEKLDRLLESVGEVGLNQRSLRARLSKLQGLSGSDIDELLDAGDRIVEELRESVMQMRLVPLESLFLRFHRTLRDAAVTTGKEVSLQVEDAAVEVDMAIVEQLSEPLTHLVRNAVDHGIEQPDEREALGKDRHGTVTLRAERSGEMVLVEVRDDGAGISREGLEARAKVWGVEDPGALSDRELWELIFEPGFSTSEEVTDLSGRGVGMDAVRSCVERMRGSVTLQSHEGVGTTVTIRVPLTLAMISGLEVGVGSTTYILPLESVVECVEIPEGIEVQGGRVTKLAGRTLPVVPMSRLLASPDSKGTGRHAVIVQHGHHVAGLVVDELTQEIETVMRPLSRPLAGIDGIGGSTVLEDGRVGLVVDVPGLLRQMSGEL